MTSTGRYAILPTAETLSDTVPPELRFSRCSSRTVVTDPAQFRELMGEPPPACVAKTIAMMDSISLRGNRLPMPVEALHEIIKQDEAERLY
jgi:hypothetical protein